KIGPDPRNFNQRVSLGRNDLLIRTFPSTCITRGVLKWFTEFGHLNRGDMLTSEQHRCHNEKKEISAQSLNANPLNWSLTRTTPWQMQPALWMSAFPQ
ncbi:hypothetical protein L8P32_23925, partial [Enterobacter chengduensis]|nr:hypothetical protein [Enterobacter chengduensis]